MTRHVHAATTTLFRRYLDMLERLPAEIARPAPPPPRTGRDNLAWMCRTALSEGATFPVDKTCRWLGFVQGVMAVDGYVEGDEAPPAALFHRYLDVLEFPPSEAVSPSPRTGRDDLITMCRTALSEGETLPLERVSRWLGFVQGVMAVNAVISVDEERDVSRPLFHAAYARDGTDIPATMEMAAPGRDPS